MITKVTVSEETDAFEIAVDNRLLVKVTQSCDNISNLTSFSVNAGCQDLNNGTYEWKPGHIRVKD
jgi:hypothetical protein